MKDIRIARKDLESFCSSVFGNLGLGRSDADAAAAVLVAADARGIPSHGVGRLWRYVNGLRSGQMRADAKPEIVTESTSSLVIDARGGMGAPVSVMAMNRVIEKAGNAGMAFASVRESNHNGISGYYAMMALPHDMIGIAMTNTAALGVPTFGRDVMFGTNPLAFAAPAGSEKGFVLDMSTTVVTRGKLEVYERLNKPLPPGWAVDRNGNAASDARSVLEDMFHRAGGGILPLGGQGLEYGGHKGFGLAVMVDILCAALSGAAFGPAISDTATTSARVSHFFGAIRIDRFRDPAEFRRDMDAMLSGLKESRPAEGAERVCYAGQREYEMEDECRLRGVPVLGRSYGDLQAIGRELGIAVPGGME